MLFKLYGTIRHFAAKFFEDTLYNQSYHHPLPLAYFSWVILNLVGVENLTIPRLKLTTIIGKTMKTNDASTKSLKETRRRMMRTLDFRALLCAMLPEGSNLESVDDR